MVNGNVNRILLTGCVLVVGISASAQVPFGYSAELSSFFYGGSWYAQSRYGQLAQHDDEDTYRSVYRMDISPSDLRRTSDFGPYVVDFEAGGYPYYTGDGDISEYVLAPTGRRVALRENFFEEDVPASQANYVVMRRLAGEELVDRYYENSRLIILGGDGNVISEPIDFVRDYVWSPDGRRLAYITGTYYEGGIGFLSTGTWILDLESRFSQKIHEGGHALHWAEWNGGLYIFELSGRPAKVLRHDGSWDRDVEPTDHQDIYFSPDGTHYYSLGRDGGFARIFQTDGDHDVTDEHPYFTEGDGRYLQPRAWLDDWTLVVSSPGAGELIYSVDRRESGRVNGFMIGGSLDDGERLTYLLVRPQSGQIEATTIERIIGR